MFKRLLNKLKSFFQKPLDIDRLKYRLGDKDGNVTITKQYQLDKRTNFKVGESYRVGEMIVTLHANKASMLKAIAKVDARRAAKEAKLRERGIELMLMTPEELLSTKIHEWMAKRQATESKLEAIVGKFTGKRYAPPVDRQPKGTVKGRFEDLTYDAGVEELIAIGKIDLDNTKKS